MSIKKAIDLNGTLQRRFVGLHVFPLMHSYEQAYRHRTWPAVCNYFRNSQHHATQIELQLSDVNKSESHHKSRREPAMLPLPGHHLPVGESIPTPFGEASISGDVIPPASPVRQRNQAEHNGLDASKRSKRCFGVLRMLI